MGDGRQTSKLCRYRDAGAFWLEASLYLRRHPTKSLNCKRRDWLLSHSALKSSFRQSAER